MSLQLFRNTVRGALQNVGSQSFIPLMTAMKEQQVSVYKEWCKLKKQQESLDSNWQSKMILHSIFPLGLMDSQGSPESLASLGSFDEAWCRNK